MESATDTEASVMSGSNPEHSDSSIIEVSSHCLEDHSEGVEFPEDERAEEKEKDAEEGSIP